LLNLQRSNGVIHLQVPAGVQPQNAYSIMKLCNFSVINNTLSQIN